MVMKKMQGGDFTMKLMGVEKEGDWLYSEWRLTYRAGWDNICKASSLIYQYTKDPEILTGDSYDKRVADVKDEKDVLDLEEEGYLTIRGMSEILDVPLMITFYNQTDMVRVTVACASEEFMEADYRNFNLSMCQFMDSAEIAMY